MNKIHYMKMTILFILIIIPLVMLSIYYNSSPMASLVMAFATYFILIANIWENNKNLKKQNIENRKNVLLSLKYQKMEDYLSYLKKYCSEI